MLVHLEEILPEGSLVEVCLDPDDPAVRELNAKGPVKGSFQIKKLGQQIVVQGSINAEVGMTCARCLKDFTREISEKVDIELRPVIDLEKDAQERALGPDDLNIEFFRGDVLDIGHFAGEQISLSIPMKPLCREDCGGICPECGKDRSQAACGCEPDTDPRWSVLKDLKNRIGEKK